MRTRIHTPQLILTPVPQHSESPPFSKVPSSPRTADVRRHRHRMLVGPRAQVAVQLVESYSEEPQQAPPAGIGMDDGVLPPGYRFYPTEEELICFYLRNKLDGLRHDIERVIPVVEVYSLDPWELSEIQSGVVLGEPWFYFCPRQEREARGGRPSRTTPSGYWKAAGTPGPVYSADDRRAIGMKKTMVFYLGRAPSGKKTTWKMNEYRALQYNPGAAVGRTTDGSSSSAHAAAAAPLNLPPQLRSEFSLCRLYTRTGVLRQFDRRPLAGAATGPGEDPGPSTAAAASPDDDDGSGGSTMQQMQLMERGGSDLYGEDVDALDDLYWPGD